MIKKITVFTLFSLIITLNTYAQSITWKDVAYIIDGDTFVSKDGKHIRLLGINTPETAKKGQKGQFMANKARLALTKLIFHKKVRLEFGERYKDKYGRLLAHIYDKNNLWINAELIKTGMAHVYSFPDNRMYTRKLIALEDKARKNKLGIWQSKRWQIYKTKQKIPDSAIGKFNLAEGKVKNITKTKDKIYINFGNNWRKDFTVEIPKKYYELFKQSGINIKEYYSNKKLQIRGVFKPVNGTLVTVTHPEQLTILP